MPVFTSGNDAKIDVAQNWSAAQTFDQATVFNSNVSIIDGNIILSTGTGTEIGTLATQKLAFYGTTPIVQEGHIADPSGGAVIDIEGRAAIDAILADLALYGLQAAS